MLNAFSLQSFESIDSEEEAFEVTEEFAKNYQALSLRYDVAGGTLLWLGLILLLLKFRQC